MASRRGRFGPTSDWTATPRFRSTCAKEFEGLLDAAEVTVVVTRGRFTNAVGFTLEGADRAVFDEKANNDEALARNNGRMVLSLSWTDVTRPRLKAQGAMRPATRPHGFRRAVRLRRRQRDPLRTFRRRRRLSGPSSPTEPESQRRPNRASLAPQP